MHLQILISFIKARLVIFSVQWIRVLAHLTFFSAIHGGFSGCIPRAKQTSFSVKSASETKDVVCEIGDTNVNNNDGLKSYDLEVKCDGDRMLSLSFDIDRGSENPGLNGKLTCKVPENSKKYPQDWTCEGIKNVVIARSLSSEDEGSESSPDSVICLIRSTTNTNSHGTHQTELGVRCDDKEDYILSYKRSSSGGATFNENKITCELTDSSEVWKCEGIDAPVKAVKKKKNEKHKKEEGKASESLNQKGKKARTCASGKGSVAIIEGGLWTICNLGSCSNGNADDPLPANLPCTPK